MAYKDIASYGVIGDMHSVALVGMDGSIDWCCLPRFDSPSIFAAILDENKGGFFKVAAVNHEVRCRQMYLPETNVLVTRFLSSEGVGEVIDFMPIARDEAACDPEFHEIIRIVRGVRGEVNFRMECGPAFDYAQSAHTLELNGHGASFTAGTRLNLLSSVPVVDRGGAAFAEFVLKSNESQTFILSLGDDPAVEPGEIRATAQQRLDDTIAGWKHWVSKCRYRGRWHEIVIRSALALKLLTYKPTGAVVAAATCSLPEELGGERNWDYRFTWIRDSSFTIYAFLKLGYTAEATAFMRWLQERATEEDTETGPLQVMYRVDGSSDLKEIELNHLEGYKGSRPVRIGNEASRQLQLDIYGELVDSIYLYNKYAEPISYDLWVYLRRLLDWVCVNWERPDHSIWEVRKDADHFVYSKMLCWVALNRGLRIAEKRGLPLDYERIRAEADRIYESIMQNGWNSERQTFTQVFGGNSVDASALMMPLMMFISPNDPRMRGTIDRILDELVSDSLVHRYELGRAIGDGLQGKEGTFSICTFWMVEALAKAGRLDSARLIFEKMLTYANHLGLYAEEIGPTGEALGNFPQAFTHLGLISAAFELDRQLKGKP
ncbi:MAG: glycoside hydrolase family 15 protein [Bryobacteraceae bacterium]